MDAPRTEQQAPAAGGDQAPTSLGFLQLHDAFQRMVAVGVDVVDEQAFYRVMKDVPEHLLWPMWQLYMRVVAGIVDNAMEEFGEVAREAGLQQQLADLEALALQKGRTLDGDDASSPTDDPAAGPAAAAAAARVAAKKAERAQLADALARLRRQRDDLSGQVDGRRRAVEGAKAGYAQVVEQMGEVHAAVAAWRAEGIMQAAHSGTA